MLACGKYHTLFLVDGQVWASGANKEGQIGNGATQTQYRPIHLKSLSGIAIVSAWHVSACVTHEGEVYMWGTPGSLTPTKIQGQCFSDVKVGGTFTLLSDLDGHIMQT